jgi:hypothetical protein
MKHSVLSAIAAVLVLAIVFVSPAQSTPADHSTSDVWWLADGSVVEGASSKLVRTDRGISLSLGTSDLPAGDAVTVWWVIFNNPEECAGEEGVPFRCAEPDLFNPDVQGSVQYAAGHVVGNSGNYNVGSYLSVGDTTNCPFEAFGEGFLCAGLIDARQADVHLVIRTHGSMDTEFMPSQIKSFEVACTPESSEGLGDGPNTCVDLQLSVHETS